MKEKEMKEYVGIQDEFKEKRKMKSMKINI